MPSFADLARRVPPELAHPVALLTSLVLRSLPPHGARRRPRPHRPQELLIVPSRSRLRFVCSESVACCFVSSRVVSMESHECQCTTRRGVRVEERVGLPKSPANYVPLRALLSRRLLAAHSRRQLHLLRLADFANERLSPAPPPLASPSLLDATFALPPHSHPSSSLAVAQDGTHKGMQARLRTERSCATDLRLLRTANCSQDDWRTSSSCPRVGSNECVTLAFVSAYRLTGMTDPFCSR